MAPLGEIPAHAELFHPAATAQVRRERCCQAAVADPVVLIPNARPDRSPSPPPRRAPSVWSRRRRFRIPLKSHLTGGRDDARCPDPSVRRPARPGRPCNRPRGECDPDHHPVHRYDYRLHKRRLPQQPPLHRHVWADGQRLWRWSGWAWRGRCVGRWPRPIPSSRPSRSRGV
jgi:hypothetical protein